MSLEQAKSLGVRVIRWLRAKVITSWLRVIERNGNRPHLHFVLRLSGELSVNTGLELIGIEIRSRAKAEGISRSWQVSTLQSSWGVARYLVKTLLPENERYRVPGRMIEYARGIERRQWWEERRA